MKSFEWPLVRKKRCLNAVNLPFIIYIITTSWEITQKQKRGHTQRQVPKKPNTSTKERIVIDSGVMLKMTRSNGF